VTSTGEKPRRVLDLLLKASGYFDSKGRESPRLAAEILLAKVIGCDRLGVYMRFEEALSEEQVDEYREYVRRRGLGEPVPYIVGEKEFHSLRFRVTREVLIPRPETEVLVEAAVGEIRAAGKHEPEVLDLGTGSGSVLVSVARELGTGRFVGVDASAGALAVARENVESLGEGLDITLREGDWFEALERGTDTFDAILSNPPYIPSADIETLGPEIAEYEPRAALDGGSDGLDAYREIAAGAGGFLRDEGFLALEVGDGQAGPVTEIFEAAGYRGETRLDLAERERVVIFRKRG
jgi:release factor glutamine methyltransferase